MDFIYLFAAVVLIMLNGFLAMAEYSLVRLRSSRLEELVRIGGRSARLISYASKHIDGYISSLQLGITMTSLGLGWVGEPAVARFIHRLIPHITGRALSDASYSVSLVLAFLIITGTHILFGELVPKLIAISSPERGSKLTIYPITALYYLSYVPMQLLRRTANGVLRIFGVRTKEIETIHSEEEIKILLGEREEEGELSLRRLLMFENLFDLGRSRAREVMTPRGSIAYLSRARQWEENLTVMMQRQASRYPVCRKDLDTYEGYIHVKDLAFECMTGVAGPDLSALKRPLLFFQEDTPLEECLRQLQFNRISLALVLDKRKKVAGLLSLEDLLEEIVGEIRDEFERIPEISLAKTFVPEATLLDEHADDRSTLLQRAVDALHAARPVFDAKDAFNQVYERERGLSSALGRETMFPHARLRSLAVPLFSFLKLKEGLDLKAPDTKPVRMVFLILTPYSEPAFQLRFLSQLARITTNESLRERLLEARDRHEIEEVIHAFEATVPL